MREEQVVATYCSSGLRFKPAEIAHTLPMPIGLDKELSKIRRIAGKKKATHPCGKWLSLKTLSNRRDD